MRKTRAVPLLIAGLVLGAMTPAAAQAAAPSTTTSTTVVFSGATLGCEAGQSPPCIAVETVDHDFDGVQELEVCVNGREVGCAQAPLSQLQRDRQLRSARATVPVTLLLIEDGEVTGVRSTPVQIAFAATGPVDRSRTMTTTVDPAGCRVRTTTVRQFRTGTLRAVLDGVTHTGSATLGIVEEERRTFAC